MYPRNAASPPRIAVGAVIQISDGAVQSSGVSVAVRPEGGSETAGGGTISYGGSSNIVYYVPTQAETNYTAFVVVAYKTGCIPVEKTVVTTESATSGRAYLASGDVNGNLPVNVKQISDDTTAADNLESACDNYSATRGLAGTALPAAAAGAAGGLPISTAGGLDLDTLLGRLDVATSTRSSHSAADVAALILATPANKLVTDGSGQVTVGTIINSVLLAIANKVEAEIIDETDSEKVLTAITDKIASVNPSLDDLTLSAIAAACRDAILDRVLAGNHDTNGTPGKLLQNADAAISTRLASASYTAPDNAGISSAASSAASAASSAATAASSAGTAATNTDTLLTNLAALALKFVGMTSLPDWLRRMTRKDAGSAGMTTAAGEIGTGGTGPTYSGTTDNLEAIKDAGGGGGGGLTEENIDDIADEVESRFQAGDVTVVSPVNEEGTVATITPGATYNENTVRLMWQNTAGSWPQAGGDLTGATVTLYFESLDEPAIDPVEAASVTATGTQRVEFDLTSEQSLALARGSWRFAIWAVKADPNGYEWPLAQGDFDINSIPRAAAE